MHEFAIVLFRDLPPHSDYLVQCSTFTKGILFLLLPIDFSNILTTVTKSWLLSKISDQNTVYIFVFVLYIYFNFDWRRHEAVCNMVHQCEIWYRRIFKQCSL